MSDKIDKRPEIAAEASFIDQLSMMWKAFLISSTRNTIIAVVAGLVAVILATAFGQVILNRWNQPFYDALQRRDLQAFFHQLVIFAEIAGCLLLLNIGQTWLNQMLRLKLREGLARDLIDEWMQPRRAFRLANAGAIGVNPDQRMHEDARHLTELSTDLGIGLLQAGILLVSFIGVLWSLSSGFVFHVWGRDIAIPGYMVWAALIYAGTASCLSWLVGRPLIRLNSDRYAREADLRFSLVRVNEHIDAIALAGGETDEKRRLELDLAGQAQLGDGRLWLGDGRGALHHRGAHLLRRRHDVRRPDGGGGRLQPGACLAALVRRQYRRHHRLARHAAARGGLPGCDAEGRCPARCREADHAR
jgi:putative ATP-binding cassette transporter